MHWYGSFLQHVLLSTLLTCLREIQLLYFSTWTSTIVMYNVWEIIKFSDRVTMGCLSLLSDVTMCVCFFCPFYIYCYFYIPCPCKCLLYFYYYYYIIVILHCAIFSVCLGHLTKLTLTWLSNWIQGHLTSNLLLPYLKIPSCTDTGSFPSRLCTGLRSDREQSHTRLCQPHTWHLREKSNRDFMKYLSHTIPPWQRLCHYSERPQGSQQGVQKSTWSTEAWTNSKNADSFIDSC